MIKNILVSFCFLLLVFGCSKDAAEVNENLTLVNDRQVLLEELAGVSCAPNYKSILLLNEIKTFFGDRIIINSIHGKFQCYPTAISKYDFRNPDAFELENSFTFFGKPSAVIDRVDFSENEIMGNDRSLWIEKITERMLIPPSLNITSTIDYDNPSRSATIKIKAEALENISGDIMLHALINEDNLVDAQMSISNGLLSNVIHNNVMKDMLTMIEGDFIADGLLIGEEVERQFKYYIPEENIGEWIPENMKVVYYFTSIDANNEVLQAGEMPIVK